MGPACPQCGKLVPIGRTQWNIGKPFACARCETQLVIPRSSATLLGVGLFIPFWIFKDRFPQHWGGVIGLLVVLLAVGLPLTWAATTVRTA